MDVAKGFNGEQKEFFASWMLERARQCNCGLPVTDLEWESWFTGHGGRSAAVKGAVTGTRAIRRPSAPLGLLRRLSFSKGTGRQFKGSGKLGRGLWMTLWRTLWVTCGHNI